MMRKHLTIEPVPGLVHYAAERCVCVTVLRVQPLAQVDGQMACREKGIF